VPSRAQTLRGVEAGGESLPLGKEYTRHVKKRTSRHNRRGWCCPRALISGSGCLTTLTSRRWSELGHGGCPPADGLDPTFTPLGVLCRRNDAGERLLDIVAQRLPIGDTQSHEWLASEGVVVAAAGQKADGCDVEPGYAGYDGAVLDDHGTVVEHHRTHAGAGSDDVALGVKDLRSACRVPDEAEAGDLGEAAVGKFHPGDRVLQNFLEVRGRDLGDDGDKIGER
jgi:hypothetical protein